jgi:hypothetical protein
VGCPPTARAGRSRWNVHVWRSILKRGWGRPSTLGVEYVRVGHRLDTVAPEDVLDSTPCIRQATSAGGYRQPGKSNVV